MAEVIRVQCQEGWRWGVLVTASVLCQSYVRKYLIRLSSVRLSFIY